MTDILNLELNTDCSRFSLTPFQKLENCVIKWENDIMLDPNYLYTSHLIA